MTSEAVLIRYFPARTVYLSLLGVTYWSSRRNLSRKDIEVTGPVTVRLWAASSAPDTDFTAKLIDVHPPNEDYHQGFAMNLCDGIIRARYRNGRERGEPMEQDDIYAFTIDLQATGNLFKRGHRIRVDISSSNFPRFDVNPNTGGPLLVPPGR